MKCPYCVEDIKDEAIVCSHCRRDLTFFKPLDQRLQTIESELAAVTECVSKISAFLDRQQLSPQPANGAASQTAAVMGQIKKPGFWRMFLVAFLLFIATIGTLLSFLFIGIALDNLGSRFLISLVVALFALPIVFGLFVGIRWRGRNLKRYLIVGLLAAAPECLILLAFAIWVLKETVDVPATEILSRFLVFALIVVARDVFGVVTGALLGDWIERRKYPERYQKTFVETFALRLSLRSGEQVGRFDGVTKRMAGLTASMAPLIPLLGVIITSVLSYYASREVKAKKALEDANQSISKTVERPPAPTPQPSP